MSAQEQAGRRLGHIPATGQLSAEAGIVDLPDPHAPAEGGPDVPGRRPPRLYVYAAAVIVALAVLLNIQGSPFPAPEASGRPSVAAGPARTSIILRARPALSDPASMVLEGPVGFVINGIRITVDLPPATEAYLYSSALLAAGSSAGDVTITTTPAITNRCVDLPAKPPGQTAGSGLFTSEVPAAGSPNGTTFLLDGYVGHYLEFTPASGSCHPNFVWDSFASGVGGRGPDARLQLWIVEVGDEYLVLGSYTLMREDPAALEGTREMVASVRVDPES